VLNDSYNQLSSAYSGLNASYFDLQLETEGLISKVDNYEQNLQNSMQWFKTNANLSGINDSVKTEQVQYSLRDNCFVIEGGKCKVKTGCLWVTNTKLGLEYKSDIEYTYQADRLLSLQDFVKSYGGDCEDYALFYKAEMNQILDECGNYVPSNIALEAFVGGGQDDYFLDFNTEQETRYYIPQAQPFQMKTGYIYPNVVCGQLYNAGTEQISGHCVVAFTKNKIKTISQLWTELNGAPLVEPQNGEYMGLINSNSGIYLASATQQHDSYIYIVITDEDEFLFDEENEVWLSYSSFSQDLELLKQELTTMLK
jgi:hypothetical protein